MLSWPALEQSLKAAVVHPPGPPRPIHPSCLMQPAPPLTTSAHTLLTDCTTLPPTSLSPSGSRILLSDPAATGHVLQSAAVGGLPTSAEHAAAARCSPPGSCRHQLIRLHHQLLRSLAWVWPAACSCKRSCCSTCAGCPVPCSVSVETQCYLSVSLPYGGTGSRGRRQGSVGQVTIATCTITSPCRRWELAKDTRN